MAAAIAARTSRIRIRLAVVILSLKHPVQLAEDLAVVDILSRGRLEVMVGSGYRAEEYAAYGIPMQRRGARMEEALTLLRRCWTEDGFDFDGEFWSLRGVDVHPKPVQRPHPPLVIGGSSVAAARRAARLADGFAPTNFALLDAWREEMTRLGKDWRAAARYNMRTSIGGSTFTHVSRQPEQSWELIREQLLYVVNSYAGWTSQRSGPAHVSGGTPEELLQTSAYALLTPQDAIDRGRALLAEGKRVRLSLQPMIGGIPWDEGQRCLDAVVSDVMPALREAGQA
jgi:alkanesulfonate monooxygenase SsuD/methylene tetrahydromethanopterin reductase-like flavin-dependent oxidoreductase (luciferase family)